MSETDIKFGMASALWTAHYGEAAGSFFIAKANFDPMRECDSNDAINKIEHYAAVAFAAARLALTASLSREAALVEALEAIDHFSLVILSAVNWSDKAHLPGVSEAVKKVSAALKSHAA